MSRWFGVRSTWFFDVVGLNVVSWLNGIGGMIFWWEDEGFIGRV